MKRTSCFLFLFFFSPYPLKAQNIKCRPSHIKAYGQTVLSVAYQSSSDKVISATYYNFTSPAKDSIYSTNSSCPVILGPEDGKTNNSVSLTYTIQSDGFIASEESMKSQTSNCNRVPQTSSKKGTSYNYDTLGHVIKRTVSYTEQDDSYMGSYTISYKESVDYTYDSLYNLIEQRHVKTNNESADTTYQVYEYYKDSLNPLSIDLFAFDDNSFYEFKPNAQLLRKITYDNSFYKSYSYHLNEEGCVDTLYERTIIGNSIDSAKYLFEYEEFSLAIQDPELPSLFGIVIFPNPSSTGMFTLKADNKGEIKVSDLFGNLKAMYNSDAQEIQLNLSQLPDGVYVASRGDRRTKIIKSR